MVDYHDLTVRFPFPWCALFHFAHVHLKAFIVDDNKSLCRLAGTPLAALCSADSRWSGKTTEPTPFLGRPEKGVKDKRESFVDAFYETRVDRPTVAPCFRSFFRRGWRTRRFERSLWARCSPLWQYAGRAFSYTTPATAFCRFLERARFIFCASNVCRAARWSGNKWSIARSDRPCENSSPS